MTTKATTATEIRRRETMTTKATTATEIRCAWEVLRDAIHARDECPDWETCPMGKLNRAERRQVTAIRELQNIGAYLDILHTERRVS